MTIRTRKEPWPHSAEAIERQMGHLKDESRANILGENMLKMFLSSEKIPY